MSETVKPFRDIQLLLLKDWAIPAEAAGKFGGDLMVALLARLAAAEKVCERRWGIACQEGVDSGETYLLKEWLATRGIGI